jgi:hypothetical protein
VTENRFAPTVIAAGVLAPASVLGAIRLAVDPDPFEAGAAALLAVGALALTIASLVGLVVARSRWARLTGLLLALLWVGVFAVSPIDPLGVVVLAVATAAAAAYAGPWAARWARRLPRADGPPTAAVVALLGLLATPVAVALASADGLHAAGWGLAIWSPAAAWALSRGLTVGLWAVRVAHPLAALGAAALTGLPGGAAVALWGLVPAIAAWHRSVADAVAALEPVASVPMPPELAPAEVLEAAGIDDRGRRTP